MNDSKTRYDNIRKAMIDQMVPERTLAELLRQGQKTWTSEEFRQDFEAIGFSAPFVMVRRISDGVRGSLMFTHRPRFYFDWTEYFEEPGQL